MIFLFEEFHYAKGYLKKVLTEDFLSGELSSFVNSEKTILNCVGFFYKKDYRISDDEKPSHQMVFVLPKVFYKKNGEKFRAFGQDISINNLEDLQRDCFSCPNITEYEAGKKNDFLHKHPRFLNELSEMLMNVMSRYDSEKKRDGISQQDSPKCSRFKHNGRELTLSHVRMQMTTFFKKNGNIFSFIATKRRGGRGKISWQETINKTDPLWKKFDEKKFGPMYLNTINKDKNIDSEDRLLVLYFSAMHYIEQVFTRPMPKSIFYEPIKIDEFERLFNGKGVAEIKRLKYKYFSDKFIELYNIMLAFFSWAGEFKKNGNEREYMLVNKFNNVFERMVDRLIGDELDADHSFLKKQRDGKRIDHIYKERNLFLAEEGNDAWFVGDSKYYGGENHIDIDDVSKQYTYAKNLIQYNIHDIYGSKIDSNCRYRDKLTEGYAVIPNFFIKGEVIEPYSFSTDDLCAEDDDLENKRLWEWRNWQFCDRLFDRDTLFLLAFKINFLYVMKMYVSSSAEARSRFKQNARRKFRDSFCNFLSTHYQFYKLVLKADCGTLENFVKKNFKDLHGKIFCPETSAKKTFLLYAEERKQSKNHYSLPKTEKRNLYQFQITSFDLLRAESDERLNPKILLIKGDPDGCYNENMGTISYSEKILDDVKYVIFHRQKSIKVYFIVGEQMDISGVKWIPVWLYKGKFQRKKKIDLPNGIHRWNDFF